ncbi:Afadin and alpha-actinin-binding-domain-containing protein [Zopfochytrium polystomum]|nr:Afadin and alpha-actinin-binding-domain-containing protein [Zopfochytrium polystomum]
MNGAVGTPTRTSCPSACTASKKANLVERLLVGAGFPALPLDAILAHLPASADAAAGGPASDAIVDCLYGLIAQIQKEFTHRQELQERLKTAAFDLETANNTVTRLKGSLEAADRQINIMSNKNKSLEESVAACQEKTSQAREELAKQTANFNTTMAQSKHKLKRKEAEFGTLQERLQKISAESGQIKGKKSGIKFVNGPLSRNLTKTRAPSKNSSPETEMYQIVTASYEEREKDLLCEIHALRQSLHSVYVDARRFLKAKNGPSEPTDQAHSRKIEESRLQLPFAMVQPEIEVLRKTLFDEMFALVADSRQKQQQTPPASPHIERMDVEGLAAEIEDYKQIIEKQAELLEKVVNGADESAKQNSNSEEEQDVLRQDIEERLQELESRSRQLDEERRKFTEAAIRLGRERSAFEREKELFEQEKHFEQTRRILEELPKTPQWLKDGSPAPKTFSMSNLPPGTDPKRKLQFQVDDILAESNTLRTTPSSKTMSSTSTPSTQRRSNGSAIKSALKRPTALKTPTPKEKENRLKE